MINKWNIFPMIQGVYLMATALWPLIHLDSFLDITGKKEDIWLVETVGLLLLPYGLMAIYSINSKKLIIIGISNIICCFSLAFIDIYYYANGTLRWVYLLDALLQQVFLIYWINYIVQVVKNNHKK